MRCGETIGKIRHWHQIEKLSISEIAKRPGGSRNTVAKYLACEVTRPRHKSRGKVYPIMGPWAAQLVAMLSKDVLGRYRHKKSLKPLKE
ncbi:MAG: hypothetical protein NVS9B10_03520 [Nevskia sp.]